MTIPKTIYKYRDWTDENHRKTILNFEVFMASPGSFNDPFDCRIPENYSLIDSDEKANLFAENITQKHRKRIIAQGYDINERKQNFKSNLKNLETFQQEHEKYEFKKTDECYGVLSLSARWNSLLMWSHYGNDHKGFCIGFNEETLRKSGLFGNGGMVTYGNIFPERNPLEDRHPMLDAALQLRHKAQDWFYEEEYRLIKLNPEGISFEERVVEVPNEAITEKRIKVYQLEKVPFEFKLKRIEI